MMARAISKQHALLYFPLRCVYKVFHLFYSTCVSFLAALRMLPGGHHSVRVLPPVFIIFTSLVFIVYQWGELASNPYKHILRLHDYLSSPIFGGDSTPIISHDAPPAEIDYRVLYSVSTEDKKYFFIDFIDSRSINPNIIPHPVAPDTWLVVAQRHDPDNFGLHPMTFEELHCNAVFRSGVLQCLEPAKWLPVVTQPGAGLCKDKYLVLNLNIGPHDARVFYGPRAPYIVYGANSNYTCFSQYVQSLESVVQWGYATFSDEGGFEDATEMQRPAPYGILEKNWFLFWDREGKVYVHYDVSPKRSFAALLDDGSVGQGRDLAAEAVGKDEMCLAKYMPSVNPTDESIHQATNSLAVTLCKRNDPGCVPDAKNTFVMSIFQHKRYRFFHSVYEPYAMLFRQEAPFEVYGISTKPFWIHGRWKPNTVMSDAKMEPKNGTIMRDYNQTEMFYVTSMSWRSSQQKYHGFIDDVVFLGFGIEDNMSAGIDVVVGDMLLDIGLC